MGGFFFFVLAKLTPVKLYQEIAKSKLNSEGIPNVTAVKLYHEND